ncbi:Hypothetical protein, putative [Bodo saltans]|uniref:Uncharacterized protein n=1 Tax=Bodo saltans TaxID=75058 RepID=A0A0S4JHF6_BODSA|nr:Hypothetical protein, putative [Bodo saltans]|eukprot:CUG89540.1 Hypothetical protein, putative [Bodo saltans]
MTSGRQALQDKKMNAMSQSSSTNKKAPPVQAKRAPVSTSTTSKTRPTPSTAPRGQGIVTPINKYAHVPSRVFSGLNTQPPHSRPSVAQNAATKPQPASISHEELFGFPAQPSTEPVTSVLQRSRFMSPQKGEGTPLMTSAAASTNDEAVVDTAPLAAPVALPVRRGPSASSSLMDLVMGDDDDIPARRSLSQRPQRSSLPRPRTVPESPHSRGRPPPAQPTPRSTIVLPESCDEDSIEVSRKSRWSIHERFPSPPSSSTGDTTAQAESVGTTSVVFSLHDESTRHSELTNRPSEVLSRHSHESTSEYTAVSPLTDVSCVSDIGTLLASDMVPQPMRLSDALRASSIDVGAMTPARSSSRRITGRSSVASSVAPGDVPPNSPASGRVSLASSVAPHDAPPNSPASAADFISPRGSMRMSTGSAVGPSAPPNTPDGGLSDSLLLTPTRASSLQRFSTSSVGLPSAPPSTPAGGVSQAQQRPSSSWADLLWPRRSGSGSLARPDEVVAASPYPPVPQSPFKSLMSEEAEDSAAPFDIASPPPNAPPPRSSLQFPADEAQPRGSIGGGIFARIRNSINLHITKVHHDSPANEQPNAADIPLTPGTQRRRSVAFCSPDRLEVRVDHNTPRGSVRHHNVDIASPAPILIRSPAPQSSAPASTARSNSPSRAKTATSSANESAARVPPLSNDAGSSLPLPSAPRSHTVDRLGRVCRSKTPGRSISPTDRDYEAEGDEDDASYSRSPAPATVSTLDVPSPPPYAPLSTIAEEASMVHRVEDVIRTHTAASALRLLTVTEIATFLVERDISFDPADRKVKLLDAARKLVLSLQRSSSDRNVSQPLVFSLPRRDHSHHHGGRKREREELQDDDIEEPNESWTVGDIRRFARDQNISLQGVPARKLSLLRHLSQSLGRSPSADMLSL